LENAILRNVIKQQDNPLAQGQMMDNVGKSHKALVAWKPQERRRNQMGEIE
jgi:hypothetical protein